MGTISTARPGSPARRGQRSRAPAVVAAATLALALAACGGADSNTATVNGAADTTPPTLQARAPLQLLPMPVAACSAG